MLVGKVCSHLLPCQEGRGPNAHEHCPRDRLGPGVMPTAGSAVGQPGEGRPCLATGQLVLEPTGDREGRPPSSAKVSCLPPSRRPGARFVWPLLHPSLALRHAPSLKACGRQEGVQVQPSAPAQPWALPTQDSLSVTGI